MSIARRPIRTSTAAERIHNDGSNQGFHCQRATSCESGHPNRDRAIRLAGCGRAPVPPYAMPYGCGKVMAELPKPHRHIRRTPNNNPSRGCNQSGNMQPAPMPRSAAPRSASNPAVIVLPVVETLRQEAGIALQRGQHEALLRKWLNLLKDQGEDDGKQGHSERNGESRECRQATIIRP